MATIKDKMKQITQNLTNAMNYPPQINEMMADYDKLAKKYNNVHWGLTKFQLPNLDEFLENVLESRILEKIDLKKTNIEKLDTEQLLKQIEKQENHKEKEKLDQELKSMELKLEELEKSLRGMVSKHDQLLQTVKTQLDQLSKDLKNNKLDDCNEGGKKIEAHLYIGKIRSALEGQKKSDRYDDWR